MIVTIVIIIVVITIVTSLTLLYMKRPIQSKTMYSLSAPQTKLQSINVPWDMTTPSSLRFAVYINSAPKTISNVGCTSVTDTTVLRQSCNDYSFTSCRCSSVNDCTNCKTDTYLTPLLSLGSFVNLMVSGYIAQSDKPLVSTLLTIKTASGSDTHIESISLPAIPLQKWTVVSLVQEGRRIDVYYGAKSVASMYLKYTPVPAYAGEGWTVGGMRGGGWVGQIGLFASSTKATSSSDVERDVSSIVDTTGMPYSQDEIDFSFDLNLPTCLFGTCSGLPPLRPPNPFSVYASSVS